MAYTNEHELEHPAVVLRDSLGALAVQILASRDDFAGMDYPEMLDELNDIIRDLHNVYARSYDRYNHG